MGYALEIHCLVTRFEHTCCELLKDCLLSIGSVVNAHIKFMYSVFLADFIFRIVMYDSIFILYKSISVRCLCSPSSFGEN